MSPRPLGFGTTRILAAINAGHRHGADIMVATGQGGGTVYKVLRRLEERGHISGRWESATLAEQERRPRRRFYRLTSSGRVELEAGLDRYRELSAAPIGRAAPGGSR